MNVPSAGGGQAVALQYRFVVRFDGQDLGAFTAISGLSVEVDVMTYAEGGLNGYEQFLPGRLKFSPVTLTRPLQRDSILPKWFSRYAAQPQQSSTAEIIALDTAGETFASWSLYGAYPVKWTGPSFSADGNAVATETLEIRHSGFVAEWGS